MSDCTPVGVPNMVSITVVTSSISSNQPTLLSQSAESSCVVTVSPNPGIFSLHAWLLCSNACKRWEFLEQLPEVSTYRRDLPPTI